MVSILFDEEYARTMREKALVEGVWEELPFVLQGIRQGLNDEEINEKFGLKKELVQKIRAEMGRPLK